MTELLTDLLELITLISKSADQKAAIAKAKQAIISDAADLAADTAAKKALDGIR